MSDRSPTVARIPGDTELERLVARSRAIGADPTLVVHGGGNTSTKTRERDHLGRERDVLRIKGSGTDLKTIGADGFPGLFLDELLPLRGRAAMSDEEMVDYLAHCMVEPGSRRPSIETLLHAFLPARHVDHVHADAICALTNTRDAERHVREALGPDVAFVPYIRPGFALSRQAAEPVRRRRDRARQARFGDLGRDARAVVWPHLGSGRPRRGVPGGARAPGARRRARSRCREHRVAPPYIARSALARWAACPARRSRATDAGRSAGRRSRGHRGAGHAGPCPAHWRAVPRRARSSVGGGRGGGVRRGIPSLFRAPPESSAARVGDALPPAASHPGARPGLHRRRHGCPHGTDERRDRRAQPPGDGPGARCVRRRRVAERTRRVRLRVLAARALQTASGAAATGILRSRRDRPGRRNRLGPCRRVPLGTRRSTPRGVRRRRGRAASDRHGLARRDGSHRRGRHDRGGDRGVRRRGPPCHAESDHGRRARSVRLPRFSSRVWAARSSGWTPRVARPSTSRRTPEAHVRTHAVQAADTAEPALVAEAVAFLASSHAAASGRATLLVGSRVG